MTSPPTIVIRVRQFLPQQLGNFHRACAKLVKAVSFGLRMLCIINLFYLYIYTSRKGQTFLLLMRFSLGGGGGGFNEPCIFDRGVVDLPWVVKAWHLEIAFRPLEIALACVDPQIYIDKSSAICGRNKKTIKCITAFVISESFLLLQQRELPSVTTTLFAPAWAAARDIDPTIPAPNSITVLPSTLGVTWWHEISWDWGTYRKINMGFLLVEKKPAKYLLCRPKGNRARVVCAEGYFPEMYWGDVNRCGGGAI